MEIVLVRGQLRRQLSRKYSSIISMKTDEPYATLFHVFMVHLSFFPLLISRVVERNSCPHPVLSNFVAARGPCSVRNCVIFLPFRHHSKVIPKWKIRLPSFSIYRYNFQRRPQRNSTSARDNQKQRKKHINE